MPKATRRAKTASFRIRPQASQKTADIVAIFKSGETISAVAKKFGVARASVYRALEGAGVR